MYRIFFTRSFPLKHCVRFLRLLPLLCAAALVLCACGTPRESLDLLREEWGEIVEFHTYDYPATDYAYFSMPPDTPDAPASRILDALPHTEIVESVYNRASKPASVASLDDVVYLRRGADGGDRYDRYGYAAVPRFADPNVSTVAQIFAAHGVACETVSVVNAAPEGQVVALRYAGFSDENGYYVNPDVPVILCVSGAKKASFEASPDAGRTVYLTFDDGPTADDTERLLDILDRWGVRGTFFTVGTAVEANPASARLIAERGHTFGCHTVTHVYEDIYASTEALEAEVVRWEEIAADAGVPLGETKYFRFPGGSACAYLTEEGAADMKKMLAGRGYLVFDWNVVTNDALLSLRGEDESPSAYIRRNFEETFARGVAENEAHPETPIIILMHETVPETVDLLPWVLGRIVQSGLSFGSLENYGRSWTYADRQN